jgi:cation diffusion facilitator family transporter
VILTTERGVHALTWSFVVLLATALVQVVIVAISESVALLADSIHNFGDAATAIPLWIAFALAQRRPTKRFTYGYGRAEDLAGVIIVFIIFVSAVVAGYESLIRFFHPKPVEHLWLVIAASVIGFAGNEAVAVYRIRVGREIGSAALVADGHHARVDGLTSLAVLVGAVGVWIGYPLADPLVGLLITATILVIVWESGRSIFTRLLDGAEPQVIDEITHVIKHAPDVQDVTEVRVRWIGHRLHAEVNLSVRPDISVQQGHEIAVNVHHRLLHHLRYLLNATIHVDPTSASGEQYHRISGHTHDDPPPHLH